MSQLKKILLRCQIQPGGFSNERTFVVPMADGRDYAGISPAMYVRDKGCEPIADGFPARGAEVAGYIEALLIKTLPGTIFVEFPDGQAVLIPADQMTHELKTTTEYVRCGSMEG